jgi:hypothetical protein
MLCILSCITPSVYAQYTTTLKITDGLSDSKLKAVIEKNGTALLTELNNAQGGRRALSLKGIAISGDAITSLTGMWEVCPFRNDELEIVESCLQRKASGGAITGYQVRNIPVIMEPKDGKLDGDKYQEIVLNFNAKGDVSDVLIAIKDMQWKSVIRDGMEVKETRRRTMVLDFVEQFRTAYNRKDTVFLENIFSDDALIITGKIVSRKTGDAGIALKSVQDVEYNVQSKATYISNLKKVFSNPNNPRINVLFDDVRVSQRQGKPIYGVKLVQSWNSGTYHDKGYLFLIWDFKDEDNPKIHVRTWQPFDIQKDKIFELSDFTDDK